MYYKVLNTSDFGLPQNRERVYIVAFHHSLGKITFDFPKQSDRKVSLADFLEDSPTDAKITERDDIQIYREFKLEESLFGTTEYPNKPIQIGIVK